MNTNNSSIVSAQDKRKEKQQKERKMNQYRLLTLKREFPKISVILHIAFTAETHQTEGQWLEEQDNMLNYECSE
jgi:hypothetical protein